MKFLMVQIPDQKTFAPPSPEVMTEMQNMVARETKAGILVMTGGISPVANGGARVRSSGGKFSVINGPFAETKDIAGGFAIIEVKSREEAIEAARRFFDVAGDGEAEIHQIR
jgi:hypothetical protein